jgi:hypothetical protein
MVIPMLWRIFGYVVCMLGVKNENHHTHPYTVAEVEHSSRRWDDWFAGQGRELASDKKRREIF